MKTNPEAIASKDIDFELIVLWTGRQGDRWVPQTRGMNDVASVFELVL